MVQGYGLASWVSRHPFAVVTGLIGGGVALIAAGTLANSAKATRARQGLADRGREGQAQVEVNEPAFVNDSGNPTLRDVGYTGFPIGPRASYPGAKGPTPPTPVYGSYGARRGGSRLVIVDPNGPLLYGKPVQSVAEKNQDLYPALPQQRIPSRGLIPIRAAGAREVVRAPSPVGPQPGGFYRYPVSLANHIDIQTQDFPGGEVGYNLAVGNFPPSAEGNLSAPVTYQEISVPGGIAATDPPGFAHITPYLTMGQGGYLAFGRELGPAPGIRHSIQSVATAQGARYAADQAGFPWWRPTGQSGPMGSLALSDDGGGYVSPGAYYVGADTTYEEPYRAFQGVETSGIDPGF